MGWRSLKVLYLDLALRSGYVIVIDIDTDLLLMYIDWRNCCMGKWCTGQAEYSIVVLNYIALQTTGFYIQIYRTYGEQWERGFAHGRMTDIA